MFRIAIGGFSHETHTFLDKRTEVEDFYAREVQYGDRVIEDNRRVRNYIQGFIEVLEEADAEMIGTVNASAGVHGYVTAEAFEKFTGDMVNGLDGVGNLDGVLLALHGAMASEEYDRAEAEVVRRVRAAVGDNIPIMVTLDLHANEDHELTDVADAVFACKEYPHTDTKETGMAAARCMLAVLTGEFRPAMAIHKPGIISPSVFQGTDVSPMKDFRARADGWEEQEPTIEYISIAAGFGYADVPDVGASVIVVANDDRELAETVAQDLSSYMWQRREELARKPILKTHEAVLEAMRLVEEGVRPVVLADGSDRTGDSTHVLRELLTQDAEGFALSSMHDPDAVRICERAGLAREVNLEIGGWGQASGEPLHVEGTVEYLGDGQYVLTGPMGTGGNVNCGPSAVLNLDRDRYVVLTSMNHQVRDDQGFRAFGLDPDSLGILLIRSRVHFRAYYDDTAGAIVEVDAPGMGPADLSVLRFEKVPPDVFPVGKNWSQ